MNINTYQQQASETAIYSNKLIYPTLGLAGEAGEIANKVKKVLRDNFGELEENVRQDLISELGDVLWYVAALATDLKVELSKVAEKNIEKLNSRKNRGVIGGSGDNR
jgi:NTP pyrophosphatase (non-canonical NTP hydrolase)